jgi:glycosyltransferase involved in cell wall biosynthesis
MKNNKLISIIVPVYNVEKYLDEMIISVLNQTYSNFELIMVDDGSTDNSLKIMKKYKEIDKRIQVYSQENDGAPGKARNYGLEKSRGEYIYYLDADDYLPSKTLEILVKNYNKDVDLVIGRTIWTDGATNWYPLREKKLSYKKQIIDLNKCSYYTFEKLSYLCSGRLFKKEIIEKAKTIFPRKYSSQDTYFSVFYNLNCKKIKIITGEVYYRRERKDINNKSQVQIVTLKSIYGRVEVMKMIVEELLKRGYKNLAYYYANVGINSNFNRIKTKKFADFKDIFLNYFKFYSKLFNKKFLSTKILEREIRSQRKNKIRSYINLIEKMAKGKMKNIKKVMFISSVGGHLVQMLQLKDLFTNYKYVLVTEKTDITNDFHNKYKIEYLLYGSRQYLFSYVFKFTFNIFKSIFLFLKYRPQVIITTGAHTAVPMCYIGWLFRRKIIFIESFAKRTSPTLSGRLVYPIATTFIVQWETMKKYYSKAKYWGWIY